MNYRLSDYLFNTNNDADYIFSALHDTEKILLNQNCTTIPVRKGKLIFSRGDSPSGLIYLTEGSAKVFIIGAEGREQIVRLVKPLSFVGYKALFAEKPHTTSAEAIEDSEIVIYSKDILDTIMKENPCFSKLIIKALAHELAFNYNRIVNLTQKHLHERLAETLLLIKDIYGFEADGITLKVRFTRENIAHFSNMTTSNAIRTLNDFKNKGIVDTQGKKIMLINLPLLRTISKTN